MTATETSNAQLGDIVVCSLESWDEVWRRNQFFVDFLLRNNPALRVLFVEPPTDPIHSIQRRMRPQLPRFRPVSGNRRLQALRPLKPLPRRLGGASDQLLLAQVSAAIKAMKLSRPILWINDATYAPLIERTSFPSVYDMTDDWLLADLPTRELERLRALERSIFEKSDAVVVCSLGLQASRQAHRDVILVPNGVDVSHFARPRARPRDLPASQTAVYVGSLHESRLDVDLVLELALSLPELTIVLVGPDSLSASTRAAFRSQPNLLTLGARPYDDVPAYLQHAEVIVVPHVVSAFTESLDPIKAYECLAVATPAVATPVAGFRELREHVTVVDRRAFADAVSAIVSAPVKHRSLASRHIPSWDQRASSFQSVLERVSDS